ncbi:hypothetical protein ABID29_001682 [Streptococcus rupicaprae]|uniref:LysM domain-containing protein n=1 Tax=Streptococcus rupicaprae TaxID=759619 RepID=A0ABV2FJ10_9STRE
MKQSLTKKMLATSTLLASFISTTSLQALNWTPRSIEEIKAELTPQPSAANPNDVQSLTETQTYTVKYGDTLSTIAEAMGIDMMVLANINQIANLDLIFPDTVLKTTYDQSNNLTNVEIQAPLPENPDQQVVASADLTTNEVKVDDQTVLVEDITQPVSPVTEHATAETTTSSEAIAEPAVTTSEVPTVTPVAEPVTSSPLTTTETNTPAEVTQPALETAPATEVTQPTTEVVSAIEVTQPVAETTPAQPAPAVEPTPVTEVAPVVETAVAPVTPAVVASTSYGDNTGLQPQTIAFKDEVASLYGISSFSLYRPGDSGDHGKGLAVDFMVPESSALGDSIADYAAANMSAKGISYIIWKQRFYSPYPSIYGPAYTWNLMPDRGSITENHYDHVHVSLNP